MYNVFLIVTPGFPERESDIGNDILNVSNEIMCISNWKNRYTRYIKNMWQTAPIGAVPISSCNYLALKKLLPNGNQDNCIWTGWRNFSLLWQEYLSSAINVLTNTPKISYLTLREVFPLNLSQIDGKCCRADFSSVWDPLKRLLPKSILKQYLVGI